MLSEIEERTVLSQHFEKYVLFSEWAMGNIIYLRNGIFLNLNNKQNGAF